MLTLFPLCASIFPPDEGSGTLPLTMTDGGVGDALPWNAKDADLSCHVTTHRIVLIDERDVVGGSIPLPLVQSAQPAGGPSFLSLRSSYKVELSTHAWGDLTIVFRGGDACSYTESSRHRDDALAAIQTAMQRKAWDDRTRQVMKEALRTSTAIAARKVGVDAIMAKNALRGESTRLNARCLLTQRKTLMLDLYSQIERMPSWSMWRSGAAEMSGVRFQRVVQVQAS